MSRRSLFSGGDPIERKAHDPFPASGGVPEVKRSGGTGG
uniref:Uncharacterized protein n=1 Tax=Siphoviridae sp. ctWhl2 TaxID=2827885 RepID=A0A8S5SBX5_9CAUD|nr:MAG TPA: hypothetical protein [Siphoviridae sp. ctWhl2]